MSTIAFDRPLKIVEAGAVEESKVETAFIKPGTPCEQAWADLCDQVWNARAEQVIECLGGWELMISQPITYRTFNAAFNDTEAGAASRLKR